MEVAPAKAAAPAKEEKKDDKKEGAPAPVKAGGITPYDLCAGTGAEMVLTLAGGSDGSVLNVTADAYLGKDDGPGKRTGLQAFQENSNVSIMAIPGVTTPEVSPPSSASARARRAASPSWISPWS